MSKAKLSFENSIKDAEDLLAHFDAVPKPPPPNAEVLKRAGLIMALTAWETYVEDRVREEVAVRLRVVDGSYVGKFVLNRLEDELKRFHTPSAEKTRKLFTDFLEVDVTQSWEWHNFDRAKIRKTLDELISRRGDVVHRSKAIVAGAPPQPHLVKRDDLEKAIRFLKSLVEATDKAFIRE
ncbi:MAG TPA: HEPN domain-containing protein [Pyrinomonadaceae bacterium]|nr:HEPN domain-containing protein [Pyrinomonadaceae bacterium]